MTAYKNKYQDPSFGIKTQNLLLVLGNKETSRITSHINCLLSWLCTSFLYGSSSSSLSSYSSLSTSQILFELSQKWMKYSKNLENNFLKSQLIINNIAIRLWTMLLLTEFLICLSKVHSFYFHLCVVTLPELVLIACRWCTNFWTYNETNRYYADVWGKKVYG